MIKTQSMMEVPDVESLKIEEAKEIDEQDDQIKDYDNLEQLIKQQAKRLPYQTFRNTMKNSALTAN